MRRIVARGLACVAVFLAAAALGIAASFQLVPKRLHDGLEQSLASAVRGPVAIARVELRLGWGLRLEAEDIALWPESDGPRLRIPRARARIAILPLLGGQVRLAHLELEGAHLRLDRDARGRFRSPPFRRGESLGEAEVPLAEREQLLAPLIWLEASLRRVLSGPLLADDLVIRGGRVELVDATAPPGRAPLILDGIEGRARRSLWLGTQVVTGHASLRANDDIFGALEWESRRRRDGDVRFALAATDLDLAALTPHLSVNGVPDLADGARFGGRLSGVVAFETPGPGDGELDVDLVVRDLRCQAPHRLGRIPIEAERASVRVVLAISPQEVRVSQAQIASGALDLRFEGAVERPLRSESIAQLKLAVREVALERALDFVGWLPEASRAGAAAVARPVEAGRLTELTAAGTAQLGGWRSLFAGRAETLPAGLEVSGELRDARIRVGENDHIDDLNGRIIWRGNRIEVRSARAEMNGSPLPTLDLSLDGVSHLLATAPAQRVLHSGAVPLQGMSALWAFLDGAEDEAPAGMQTRLELQIDHLEHPMLLWPIHRVRARVEPVAGGVHIVAESGNWAGAPVRASADWLFDPTEHVVVRAEATAPAPGSHPAHARGTWAEGRFAVAAFQKGIWRQRGARGSFAASSGTLRLGNVAIDLEPGGRLTAAASLDLARPDVVPFRLNLSVRDGDLGALASQVGLPADAATGHLELDGSFAGQLRRDRFFRDLSGRLELTAVDGEIRRRLPAVVALALASEGFNPFAGKEAVRYDEIATELAFEDGVVRTDSFTLDGPDLRVVAAGAVDLAREPHTLDADVALFLFRQIDRVLSKIPLLNRLLLGPDDNLVAAYYSLKGPWGDPKVHLVPLRSLASGPGSLVFETLPDVLKRGWKALGAALRRGEARADGPDQDGPASPGSGS